MTHARSYIAMISSTALGGRTARRLPHSRLGLERYYRPDQTVDLAGGHGWIALDCGSQLQFAGPVNSMVRTTPSVPNLVLLEGRK